MHSWTKLEWVGNAFAPESAQHGSDIVVVEMLFSHRSLDFWSRDARNPDGQEGP
jgi:hypothetical protein